MEDESTIRNPTLVPIIVSILVKRLGGEVKITQEDVDAIAFSTLTEDRYEDGSIGFKVKKRKMVG